MRQPCAARLLREAVSVPTQRRLGVQPLAARRTDDTEQQGSEQLFGQVVGKLGLLDVEGEPGPCGSTDELLAQRQRGQRQRNAVDHGRARAFGRLELVPPLLDVGRGVGVRGAARRVVHMRDGAIVDDVTVRPVHDPR